MTRPAAVPPAPTLALRASQLAAFLVPGVALSVPSGYSVGAAALALAALVFVRQWWGQPWDRRAVVLGGLIAVMGVLWSLSFDGWSLKPRNDQFYKYLLAIAGLGFLQLYAPKVRPLGWGMLAGALGAGLVACYQMGWTDSAVRRFVRDAGPLLDRLVDLTRSDCTTRNQRKAQELSRRMDALEERIEVLAVEEELAAIRPDLDGKAVIELLGIEPGPVVGRALNHLLELRLEEGPLEPERAEAELLKWWADQNA